MIAELVDKGKYWACSECKMRQKQLDDGYCWFCGAIFTNWEEVLWKRKKEEDELEFDLQRVRQNGQ